MFRHPVPAFDCLVGRMALESCGQMTLTVYGRDVLIGALHFLHADNLGGATVMCNYRCYHSQKTRDRGDSFRALACHGDDKTHR